MGSYVSLVQAGYALDLDEEAWVDGLVAALESLFGFSSAAYVVRPEEEGARRIGPCATRGHWAPPIEHHLAQNATFSPELMRIAYQGGPFAELASERAARDASGSLGGVIGSWKSSEPARAAPVDIIGVYGGSFSGGCMLCVFSERGRLAPRTRWALRRVAVHIAAAYRLRRRGHGGPDAVLDEHGELLEGDVGSDSNAALLRDAATKLQHSRAIATSRPESAIAVWEGLVDGRWSLLRSFDRSGRRHLLLRRNEIEDAKGDHPRTRRVASVAALAARGHSNKLIAYELGVPISTVASDLKEFLSKLGLSRIELVRLGPDGSLGA